MLCFNRTRCKFCIKELNEEDVDDSCRVAYYGAKVIDAVKFGGASILIHGDHHSLRNIETYYQIRA